MPTYKLTIEYEGTRYSGWQVQSNTGRTIQGKLITAAREEWPEADLGGAGRTDAGVHASGQVAHLRLKRRVPPELLPRSMNDRLPSDIHILRAEEAADSFHARHDALSRIYLYQVSKRRTAFAKPFVWWIRDDLNVQAMRTAAAALAGRHDFALLADRRAAGESTLVEVEEVSLGTEGELILLRIRASHFLWKMVRKVVAMLVEVGRENLSVGEVERLIGGRGEPFQPTAPPSGLFLEAVTYEGETFERPLASIVPVSALPRTDSGGRRRKR
jgi:tRNA pseudouridine38-40 synthase